MEKLQITQAISEQTVILNAPPFSTKDELFRFMAEKFKSVGRINSEEDFIKALYDRENTGPTYMGNLIAIPHGKSIAVQRATIGFCRMTEPMSYSSCNEEGPVKMVFMLAVPNDTDTDDYLKILANLARLLMHEDFIGALESAENFESVVSAFETYQKKYIGV